MFAPRVTDVTSFLQCLALYIKASSRSRNVISDHFKSRCLFGWSSAFALASCSFRAKLRLSLNYPRSAFDQLNAILAHVNAGFNSLASILRAMKKKADEDRAKLTQLASDVRRIEDDRAGLPEAIKQSFNKLKVSVQKLKDFAGCEKGWTQRGNKCYKFTKCVATRCTMAVFKDECKKEGAQLASIRSAEENEFVASLAAKTNFQYLFLGGTRDNKTNTWVWPDGSAANYTNWIPGQPDNIEGVQHCLLISLKKGNKWDDGHCTGQYYHNVSGYACDKNL